MNLLHWISGAAGRRDRRRREERRRLRRQRQDVDIVDEDNYHHHDHNSESYWTGGIPYSYRHGSPMSTPEQEPRVIFVNPGPEYFVEDDRDMEDYGYHRKHRRHHRKRRHERAYSTPSETQSYTCYEDIPEEWYRQQYYPPIPDREPLYEQNRGRKYSLGEDPDVGRYAQSHCHSPSSVHTHVTYDGIPEVISVSPNTNRKIDTIPIYDTDVQRALEESYAQAERDRREERRQERRREREMFREAAAAQSGSDYQRRSRYDNQVEEERRGRSRRIAELEAEIQARELHQELRHRDREWERDSDRDRQTGRSTRKSYRSASVSEVDSLAGRLDGFDLRAETHSPTPSSSSHQHRRKQRYVGSLGGGGWAGQRHETGEADVEAEREAYYLRPRVRFSPAVSYERDFVRRPRVYYSPADLERDYNYGRAGGKYGCY
ncbi:hypothetical protein V8F20_007116 [Naviculisporaceae sp. PSN 640]